MKKTFYFLYNKSMSVGQYLMDDDYIYLNPGCEVILERKPTNWTENIVLSIFKKEVAEPVKEDTSKQVKNNKQRKGKNN